MPAKENFQLASREEDAMVERYIPREWTIDPDFVINAGRHDDQPDWLSRTLGWLAVR